MQFTRRVLAQNRIIIPQVVREVLNIQKGDVLEIKITAWGQTAHETVAVAQDGVVCFPKSLRELLSLEEGDIVQVKIKNVIKRKEDRKG